MAIMAVFTGVSCLGHVAMILAMRAPKNSVFGNMHNGYIVFLTNCTYIAKFILH